MTEKIYMMKCSSVSKHKLCNAQKGLTSTSSSERFHVAGLRKASASDFRNVLPVKVDWTSRANGIAVTAISF